jgi:hypothetical protein
VPFPVVYLSNFPCPLTVLTMEVMSVLDIPRAHRLVHCCREVMSTHRLIGVGPMPSVILFGRWFSSDVECTEFCRNIPEVPPSVICAQSFRR